jgi:hypothetical protein
VIYLKDTVKPAMRERFADLRAMGIRTVMITGDNPQTATTIAAAWPSSPPSTTIKPVPDLPSPDVARGGARGSPGMERAQAAMPIPIVCSITSNGRWSVTNSA